MPLSGFDIQTERNPFCSRKCFLMLLMPQQVKGKKKEKEKVHLAAMSSASRVLSRKTGPTATAEALRTLAKGQGKHWVFYKTSL